MGRVRICLLETEPLGNPPLLRTVVLHRNRKLNGFLRDFGYDTQLLKDDQVDEKGLRNLRGVVRTSYTTLNGRCYQNLDAFAPAADWEALECTSLAHSDLQDGSDGL